jgi:hypothetical protein
VFFACNDEEIKASLSPVIAPELLYESLGGTKVSPAPSTGSAHGKPPLTSFIASQLHQYVAQFFNNKESLQLSSPH